MSLPSLNTPVSVPLPISVAAVDNIPSALVGSTPSPAILVVIFNHSGKMSPNVVVEVLVTNPAVLDVGIGISSNAPADTPAVAAAVSI